MWDAFCRSFEHFEVVGLIFHKPDFVTACSEGALDRALKALLVVIKATTDKVGLVVYITVYWPNKWGFGI